MSRPRLRFLPAALAALALLAAGCGEDDETTATSADTTAATATTTAPAEPLEGAAETAGGAADDPASALPPAEAQIEAGVKVFLMSPNGEQVCGELLSDEALESFYGSRNGCLEGRPNATLADSVKIARPKVQESTATVTAVPKGGLYDGIEVEFTFVSEGGLWLIDSIQADVPVGP